jgi:two-component system sensor histidine kinase/response regulator
MITTLEGILLLLLVGGIIHVNLLLRKRSAINRLLQQAEEQNQELAQELPKLYSQNQDLSKSNEYYKDLVEVANDLIFRCDINGYFLYSNTKAFRTWGLDERELLGKKYLDFIREDFRRTAEKFFFRQFITKQETSYFEYPAIGLNNQEIWLGQNTQLIFEDGNPIGFQAVARDITILKNTQAQLAESEERYRNIVDILQEGIVIQNANYEIIAANRSAESILGLTLDQLRGLSPFDPLWRAIRENGSPFEGEEHPGTVSLRTGQPQSNIIMGIYGDHRELVWVSINSQPIFKNENPKPHEAVVSFTDITKRKNTENELLRSNANIEAWMNNTKDAIWSVDEHFTILACNSYFKKLFKLFYGNDINKGDNIIENMPLDTRDFAANLYKRALSGEGFTVEYPVISKEGVVFFELTLNPIYESNIITGVAVLSKDVTSRKNTEQALKQTMLLQRAILDSSNYMIIATTLDGTITTFNPAAEKAIGYSADELVGSHSPAIFHDLNEIIRRAGILTQELGFEVQPGFDTFIAKAKLGQLYEDEWMYIRKDGSRFPVKLSISALQNTENEITGYLGIATDITEQKQTLAELEKRDMLLEGTARALRHLITATNFEEGVQDVLSIIGTAADADRVYFCRSYLFEHKTPMIQLMVEWQKYFVEANELQYQPISYLDAGVPRWYNILSGGSIIQGTKGNFPDDEQEILAKAGIHSLIVLPVILHGNLWGFFGVNDFHSERVWADWERASFQSIAASLAGAIERHNAQENLKNQAQNLEIKNTELTHARESAEIANRAKSAFLSNMSHELRTPLNAILGFAQILQKDKTLPEQNRNYISMMYRSGNHLLEMINDVLDISKIEAGHMDILSEEFDLHELIADIGEMFALRCKEKNLILNIPSIAPDIRYVVADHKRLKQVLINLTANAIKFTYTGSVSISAVEIKRTAIQTLAGSDEITWVQFAVTDTGRGIPPEQLYSIFEPFKQVSGMYSDGTGLGLAICDRIIRMMNGEIKIQSTIGVGSTFTFEIPMQVRQVPSIIKSSETKPIVGIKSDKQWRILVVDDIPTNCIVARGVLEPLGFVCAEANTGLTAIEQVKVFQPDIVLMDILMPDMNGDEATTILRAMPEYALLPIIALTASGFDSKRDELMALGFSEYMRKPFLENELLAMIEQFIPVEYIRDEKDDNFYTVDDEISSTEIAQRIQELPEKFRKEISEAIEFQDFEQIELLIAQLPKTDLYHQVQSTLQKAILLSNYKLLMAITKNLE